MTETYKLANRKLHPDPTTVKAGPASIGPDNMTIMAGPCAVETEDQLMLIAKAVKASGATIPVSYTHLHGIRNLFLPAAATALHRYGERREKA